MPEAPARLIVTLSHQILFHSSDNYNDEKKNNSNKQQQKLHDYGGHCFDQE